LISIYTTKSEPILNEIDRLPRPQRGKNSTKIRRAGPTAKPSVCYGVNKNSSFCLPRRKCEALSFGARPPLPFRGQAAERLLI